MSRQLWVLVHRYAGLSMAGLLIVVGLTGSLLAFYKEIDALINPRVYKVSNGVPMTAGELAIRVESITGFRAERVYLGQKDEAAWVRISAPLGVGEPTFKYLRLDPVTGEEIARQNWGVISEGWGNLMQFIYRLHYELALGSFGLWVLGICALVWTLDSFIGLYLTFPVVRRHGLPDRGTGLGASPVAGGMEAGIASGTNRKSWLSRWLPAWKIRWGAGQYKINFDLHCAGGLWLWGMLLIFAWSSVYMNLGDTVYRGVMRIVADYHIVSDLPTLETSLDTPKLNWRDAQQVADRLITEQARIHGFTMRHPVSLELDRMRGTYIYRIRSTLDIQDKRGVTSLSFDANTGAVRQLLLPSGQYAGNTITNWLYALHTANIFGLPYQIFVSLMGLIIVMLSITGIIIWWKKRQARRYARVAGRIAHA
jgi:uncharacterized iron-regulated membrane protein